MTTRAPSAAVVKPPIPIRSSLRPPPRPIVSPGEILSSSRTIVNQNVNSHSGLSRTRSDASALPHPQPSPIIIQPPFPTSVRSPRTERKTAPNLLKPLTDDPVRLHGSSTETLVNSTPNEQVNVMFRTSHSSNNKSRKHSPGNSSPDSQTRVIRKRLKSDADAELHPDSLMPSAKPTNPLREKPLPPLPLEITRSTRNTVTFSSAPLSPIMSENTEGDEPDTHYSPVGSDKSWRTSGRDSKGRPRRKSSQSFNTRPSYRSSSTRTTSKSTSTSGYTSTSSFSALSYGPYVDHVSIYSGYNTRFVVDQRGSEISERLGLSRAEMHGSIYDMPPLYRCRVVHPCRPPTYVNYRGLPFFSLEPGDMLDVLRDEGHPKDHNLPVRIMNGEDCLLLVRDMQGNLGWILSHKNFNS